MPLAQAQGRIGTRPMSGRVRRAVRLYAAYARSVSGPWAACGALRAVVLCGDAPRSRWSSAPWSSCSSGSCVLVFLVFLDAGAQVADFAFQGVGGVVGVVEVADLGAQGPGVDGFHDEVGDAEAEGGGGEFGVGAEAGEEDDGDVLGLFHAAHVADDVEAADAGHADVEEEQTDPAAEDFLEGRVAAGGARQAVAQRGQGALQGVQGVLVVVDDEDPGIPTA